jgi:hypothetical protein
MGITILLSGHHFIKYAHDVATQLEAESRKLAAEQPAAKLGPAFDSQGYVGGVK